MYLEEFHSIDDDHYHMGVRCDAVYVEFQIVLPEDTIDSILREFQAEFPKEDAASFRAILNTYFPVRCGKFTSYYHKWTLVLPHYLYFFFVVPYQTHNVYIVHFRSPLPSPIDNHENFR